MSLNVIEMHGLSRWIYRRCNKQNQVCVYILAHLTITLTRISRHLFFFTVLFFLKCTIHWFSKSSSVCEIFNRIFLYDNHKPPTKVETNECRCLICKMPHNILTNAKKIENWYLKRIMHRLKLWRILRYSGRNNILIPA